MQFIIFWNFSMFQYRPDSPQVKQNLISTITNFVCELPHELQNGLRLITLGNQEILEKPQIWVETVSNPEKKLAISVKKYAEADIKVLQSGPILLDFLIPLQLPHPTPPRIVGVHHGISVTEISLNVSDGSHSCCS